MLIYIEFVLFLQVYLTHSFELRQINEKLGYIEDRINAESKFRRNDFSILFSEINSLKEMIQHSFETKMEGMETKHNDYARKDITKELEEKILRMTTGFSEEKILNVRLRRKTMELYRQVADLKTKTDKTADVLERLLKGVEILTRQKEEHENCFNLFRGEISEIKINVNNLTDNLEQRKEHEEQKIDSLYTYAENITENIQHLKANQKLCLEKVNIRKDKIIAQGEKHDNEMINSEEHNVCSCSNASFVEQSTPSREQPEALYKSCKELYNNGVKSNGIYQIDTGEDKPPSVYCDMDTDDGGWTVFQRRQDGSVDFFRDWNAYKYGFGDLNGEFWLGNKYLNLLTDDDEQHELRIDLEDFEGNRAYAKYSSFKVQPEDMKYTLEVSGYTGNAGDSLGTATRRTFIHDKMKFSTKDNDNDNDNGFYCAFYNEGGWWFNSCFISHLNGPYSQNAVCKLGEKCIIWSTWKGWKTSMKYTQMKLR